MNGAKYPRKWELINPKEDWERLRVPRGWIVHHSSRYLSGNNIDRISECAIFIPDENHEWILEET